MKKQVQDISLLEEPLAVYGADPAIPMFGIFGKQTASPTSFDLLQLARKGISKKSITQLAKQITLTLEEISAVLHISERTLQRYTPNTLVKTEHADRVIELARLYERGISVLGSTEAFNIWMRQPNRALNDEIPLQLLDTSIGFELVLQVLGRLDYGVFS